MAFYAEPCQIFESSVRQQLELLQGKRDTVSVATEMFINRIQKEVEDWVNGGNVNQLTFEVISNRIQQAMTFFIAKAVEFSVPLGNVTVNDVRPTPLLHSSTSKNVHECKKGDTPQIDTSFNQEELMHTKCTDIEVNLDKGMTSRFSILEEAVSLLKKVTEKVQEKQENLERSLKEFTIVQDDVNKNLETLTKCQNNSNTQITKIEEQAEMISSKVYHLLKTVTDLVGKVTGLEEYNVSVKTSMADINKQMNAVSISSSNDTEKSVEDMSKRVESTNQQYNEISDKINLLEKSIKDTSSQIRNELDASNRRYKVQFDDSIGMVCQILAKKLSPLETLKETLNKKVDSRSAHISKLQREAIVKRVAAISTRLDQIETKFNLPIVGFTAKKTLHTRVTDCKLHINHFENVEVNHGGHFNPKSGVFMAPRDSFYFVSISTYFSAHSRTMKTICYRRGKDQTITEDEESISFVVEGNQTISRCIHLTAGDTLYFLSTSGFLSIYVSCFMIK